MINMYKPISFFDRVVISFKLFSFVTESSDHDVCGFPGLPSNGSLGSSSSYLFSAGQEVTYQCQEAFVLFGPDKRICQNNGTWSPLALPECRKYNCKYFHFFLLLFKSPKSILAVSQKLIPPLLRTKVLSKERYFE